MYKRNTPTAPKAKVTQAPRPNLKTKAAPKMPAPKPMFGKQGFTNQQTSKKKK